ncbi:hypothetical protein RvY_07223 [Ramazzottius varieornatus]|uniref:Uncharacterized protein n=1 Tax=Ramazzottius varieornatus TaxID=947166 RepID=A0A1D1V7I2_RAMVA|nr:hypothetical protein RvY_07223 [Ramazzottius varieornatus]
MSPGQQASPHNHIPTLQACLPSPVKTFLRNLARFCLSPDSITCTEMTPSETFAIPCTPSGKCSDAKARIPHVTAESSTSVMLWRSAETRQQYSFRSTATLVVLEMCLS